MDAQHVSQIIEQFMSPDNETRQGAERTMKQRRQTDSEAFLGQLVAYINEQGLADDKIKQNQASLACLLLKKQYLDDRDEEKEMWQLNNEHIVELRNQISQSINFLTNSKLLLERKADIICKCYRKLEIYPEMIQKLVTILKSRDGTQPEIIKRKQFAMYNFEILSEYHLSQELLVENSKDFIDLFQETLEDDNIEIKVASLKAITSFLSSIDEEEIVLKYKALSNKLLNVVIVVMKQDEDQGQQSLEFMIELTQTHPDIWADSVNDLIFVVSEVIKNREFKDATRQSALEIVLALSESAATMLRKYADQLKDNLFPAIAYMMTEVDYDDDLEGWYQLQDEEMQTRNDPCSVASEGLQRLSVFLGEKTTLLCSSNIIKAAIESGVWKEQFMGYRFLGMISEACKKSFTKNIEEIIQMAVSGFTVENPRIKYESLQATGLLLNDIRPTVQVKYHAVLVDAFIKMMNNEPKLKLQTQACACMTSFVRGLIDEECAEDSETQQKNKKVLLPYADVILDSIANLLQKSIDENYQPLQEEVLATLSCIASLFDKSFAPYYNKFMPGLKNILQTGKWETKQEQELRANCVECIGCIIVSVKDQPEICKNDAIQICQMIIDTKLSDQVKDSDPYMHASSNCLSQLCSVLKDDFKQFLPKIVPSLIQDAQRDIDIKVSDADDLDEHADGTKGEDEEDSDDKIQSMQVKVRGIEGTKQVSINTSALEVKSNAVEILKNIARNMGTSFFDYVEDVAKVCLEKLIRDNISSQIRKHSAKLMRFLIAACKDHPDKQRGLFIMSYIKMMEELEVRRQKEEFETMNTILKEVNKQMHVFSHFKRQGRVLFEEKDAKELVDRVKQILEMIKNDKADRKKKVAALAKHMDEEDLDFFTGNLEQVDKGIRHIMEISGFLLQNNSEVMSPYIGQQLLECYATVLLDISDKKDYELLDSACFLCDCVEHGNDQLFNLIVGQTGPKFMELIHHAAKDKDDINYDLLQSCVWGIGEIARRLPNGQFAQLQDIMQVLMFTCKDETTGKELDEDEKESKELVRDNSISTLTKIVLFQSDGGNIVKQEIVDELFGSLLPITKDIEEAQVLHELFLTQALAENQIIVNNGVQFKGIIERMKTHAEQHKGNEDEDILGEHALPLLQQIVQKM